jgi:hypothetical protein
MRPEGYCSALMSPVWNRLCFLIGDSLAEGSSNFSPRSPFSAL